MNTILLFDPTGFVPPKLDRPRQTSTMLAGKVVGFIDNSKPNFDHLVDDLAACLTTQHGVTRIVRHRKRAASVPAAAAILDDLARECDVVIIGSGD